MNINLGNLGTFNPSSSSRMNNIVAQEFYVVSSTSPSFQTSFDYDRSQGYTHVVVTSACIPKTYYVLPNDATVTVNQNGQYSFVTMPAGNYNVLSFPGLFATVINNTLGISPFVYSVSFANDLTKLQTSKFTYSVTGNNGVQPVFTVNDPYLARVMGFNQGEAYVFAGNSLVSANVINFQSYDELLIKSNGEQ